MTKLDRRDYQSPNEEAKIISTWLKWFVIGVIVGVPVLMVLLFLIILWKR